MIPIKSLDYLLLVTNVFGIYRNFCNQTKIKKYLIVFQILVEIILCAVIVIAEFFMLLRDNSSELELIYGIFTGTAYINFLSSVLTGIYYSCAFESYLESIIRIYECFKEDMKFRNSLKKINYFCLFCVLVTFVVVIYRTVELLIRYLIVNLFVMVFICVSQFLIRMSIVLQHFLLFVVTMIVVSLVQCVNSTISATQQRVSRHISLGEDFHITKEQIQEWVELYRVLINCCDKVMLCFGRQFLFSLALTILHYVFIAYYLCYIAILKVDTTEFKKMIFIVFAYFISLMLPIVAGQMVRNKAVDLHRSLARLYNTILIGSSEAEAKLIKDFIRLLKKKPLEIKFDAKLPAGMYMLPVILSFSINRIIVLLQFNHVV